MKWRDDTEFLEWMISMQYAERNGKKICHYFGSDGKADGIILYMYEAWCAGKESNG